MTVLAVALNLKTKARAYIYAAGLLFGISTSLWWLLVGQERFHLSEFLLVNLIANSLAGVIWLLLDLRSRQRESSLSYYFSFHNIAALFSLGVLALVVFVTPHLDLDTPQFDVAGFCFRSCLNDRLFVGSLCEVCGRRSLHAWSNRMCDCAPAVSR